MKVDDVEVAAQRLEEGLEVDVGPVARADDPVGREAERRSAVLPHLDLVPSRAQALSHRPGLVRDVEGSVQNPQGVLAYSRLSASYAT